MFSATLSRLLFFGGHYISVLFLARKLGSDAHGVLLAAAVVELAKVVFDFGLENNILARAHQRGVTADQFNAGKGGFRLITACAGQFVATCVILFFCLRNEMAPLVPVLISFQLLFLMGFGYLQALIQTSVDLSPRVLAKPIAIALSLQLILMVLVELDILGHWILAISFQSLAFLMTVMGVRSKGALSGGILAARMALTLPSIDRAGLRAVLTATMPLGKVALVGVAYGRVDAFIVSLVLSGPLLTQYLLFQRLGSAPLMLFATIASVSIAALSSQFATANGFTGQLSRVRLVAYWLAVGTGAIVAVASPFIAVIFSMPSIAWALLALQCLLLAFQISNGFHSAILIAAGRGALLLKVARNNAFLAAAVLPLSVWGGGALGLAAGLCTIEFFGAVQYIYIFSRAEFRNEVSNVDAQ